MARDSVKPPSIQDTPIPVKKAYDPKMPIVPKLRNHDIVFSQYLCDR
jgi:hypothetical protein